MSLNKQIVSILSPPHTYICIHMYVQYFSTYLLKISFSLLVAIIFFTIAYFGAKLPDTFVIFWVSDFLILFLSTFHLYFFLKEDSLVFFNGSLASIYGTLEIIWCQNLIQLLFLSPVLRFLYSFHSWIVFQILTNSLNLPIIQVKSMDFVCHKRLKNHHFNFLDMYVAPLFLFIHIFALNINLIYILPSIFLYF